MKRSPHLSFILIIAFAFLSHAALATHEADHRYNVKGFVLDENEEPIARSAVSIHLDNKVIGYQETNSQGYYNIRLHLHDADLGKKLNVRTAGGEATIQVTFTRGDKATARIHYANLVGGKLVERRLVRNPFPTWAFAATIAIVAIVSTAIIVGRRVKRRRKRELAKERTRERKKRKRKNR